MISGYCQIKDNCFIGVNSTFSDNVVVEKDCIVGAGAIILKNTEEGRIYAAIPSEKAKVGSLRYYKVRD